jgi:hypothetical protein
VGTCANKVTPSGKIPPENTDSKRGFIALFKKNSQKIWSDVPLDIPTISQKKIDNTVNPLNNQSIKCANH